MGNFGLDHGGPRELLGWTTADHEKEFFGPHYPKVWPRLASSLPTMLYPQRTKQDLEKPLHQKQSKCGDLKTLSQSERHCSPAGNTTGTKPGAVTLLPQPYIHCSGTVLRKPRRAVGTRLRGKARGAPPPPRLQRCTDPKAANGKPKQKGERWKQNGGRQKASWGPRREGVRRPRRRSRRSWRSGARRTLSLWHGAKSAKNAFTAENSTEGDGSTGRGGPGEGIILMVSEFCFLAELLYFLFAGLRLGLRSRFGVGLGLRLGVRVREYG